MRAQDHAGHDTRAELRPSDAPKSRILIRCDASAAIGLGHVVRCGALAGALVDAGAAAVEFATSSPDEIPAGFRTHVVPGGARLGDDDLRATLVAAEAADADCVLVDHYGARPDYLRAVRASERTVGVVDDRADRDLTAAGWVLNPNLAAPSLAYVTRPGATLLLGPRYALLRPSFAARRASSPPAIRAVGRRVLVTLGGGETDAQTAEVVRALADVPGPLEVRCVVAGGPAPACTATAAASPHDVRILARPVDMSAVMAWADLSINAGGSTVWELSCLGVPMVVVSLSPDQRNNPPALADAGAAWHGSFDDLDGLAAAAARLLADEDARRAMSDAGRALVDGEGAGRAATSLLACAGRDRKGKRGAVGSHR